MRRIHPLFFELQGSNIKTHLVLFTFCFALTSRCVAMQPIFALTGATTVFSTQQSQSFTHDDTIFEYQTDQSPFQNFMVGGFIGEEYAINQIWRLQFGLAFYRAISSSIQGDETEAPAGNPETANFWGYEYEVASSQLLFENKLLFTWDEVYHPYLLVGVGEGFNRTSQFQATPDNAGEVATALYGPHQNNSFIYEIGAGFETDVLRNIRVGVGYRMATLGKHDLGTGTLDTGLGGGVFSIPALKSSESFNHEIFIQLTYLL